MTRDTEFLLAIDPGRDQGWALLRCADRALLSCGLGETPDRFFDAPKRSLRVVVEHPQIYPQSPVPPNDIVTLAVRVGRVAERWESRGYDVEFIFPRTWKGTLEKSVCTARIKASLGPVDRNVLDSCMMHVAQGKRHNAIDAVGLGRWALKRTRAGLF